jgi:hypothetical protein
MSEGHIYVSYWERNERGYEGWMERWPKRRVSGETFYEMREALGNVVGEEVGDGEPNFEFEPPFIEAAGWEHLFRDGWRSTYLLRRPRLTTDVGLFDGGFCGQCKWPVGNRTNETLRVERDSWPKGIKSFAAVARHTMRIPVASKGLLDIFTSEERESFEFRPVETIPAARTRFYEFVPRRFVSEVGGKALQADGWHCRQCGRRYVSNSRVLGYGPRVVSRDAIEPGAGLFFLGDAGNFSVCLSADRWEELKATLRAAEITSSLIAIIEAGEREESPVLQEYKGKAS